MIDLFFKECREGRLSAWQCPQFVFLVIGIIIIASLGGTYYVGTILTLDPGIVAMIAMLLATVLLILDFLITRSFERLAEASRMKSDFISIVSHQLRSPISNIKWTIEALQEEMLTHTNAKEREYLQVITENSERMAELASDLITVSRIEEGKFAPQTTLLSLETIVEKARRQLEPFARSRHITVDVLRDKNLPLVLADESQLRHIVENLLDNAIKYSRPGGRVLLRLLKTKEGVQCGITDEGIGIPEADWPFVFHKFFRSRNAKSQQTGGSGLGLYIVKSMVENIGGTISFTSKLNEGTTFTFILKITREPKVNTH